MFSLFYTISGDVMERRTTEQTIDRMKKAVNKKSPCLITQIQGVGSQKYSIHFVKKGY